jgi:hypothetical protein
MSHYRHSQTQRSNLRRWSDDARTGMKRRQRNKIAIDLGWLWLHEGGKYVKLSQSGADPVLRGPNYIVANAIRPE